VTETFIISQRCIVYLRGTIAGYEQLITLQGVNGGLGAFSAGVYVYRVISVFVYGSAGLSPGSHITVIQ